MIGDGEEDRWQDCDQAGENAVVRISDIFHFQASVVYYVLIILPNAVGAAKISKL